MVDLDIAPEGYVYVWVPCREIPSDRRWELVRPADSKQCRWTTRGERCPHSSVARLDRAYRTDGRADAPPQWWHYCGRHLYGRRIINGEVQSRILVDTRAS
jgi:hypothetical protein